MERTVRDTLKKLAARLGPWLQQTSTQTALLGLLGLAVTHYTVGTSWHTLAPPAASVVFGLVFRDRATREEAERIVTAYLAAQGKKA